MISTFTAFFDANVFFGARLRSLFLYAALGGDFRARWSEDVHREWMRAVVAGRADISLASLERTRQLMDGAVPDCLVTGYESLLSALQLPDPDDRHILAAAIVGRADVIVTCNDKDFPTEALAPFRLHTRHPDRFLLELAGIRASALIDAAVLDFAHYGDLTLDAYFDDLERAGVPGTAEYLRQFRVLFVT